MKFILSRNKEYENDSKKWMIGYAVYSGISLRSAWSSEISLYGIMQGEIN